MYYIVAYRESGPISQSRIPFKDLEAAKFCAEMAAYHFGPDYTVIVEGDDDGPEPQLRSTDHDTARDTAANDPPS